MLIQWLREMRYYEADPGTPSGGTGETPPATPPDSEENSEEDFDKARAMETIRKLRQVEKDATKAQKRLAELEAADKARADADLSETERLKKELSELRAQHKQASTELTRARILEAARKAAATKGLTFHDTALEDALRLGDLDEIEVREDGSIVKAGEAVAALAKNKPHWLKPATSASADLDGVRRGNTTKESEEATKRASLAQRWGFKQG